MTVIGALALAALGEWLLVFASVVLLVFEVRTIRSFGRKLAALQQRERD